MPFAAGAVVRNTRSNPTQAAPNDQASAYNAIPHALLWATHSSDSFCVQDIEATDVYSETIISDVLDEEWIR